MEFLWRCIFDLLLAIKQNFKQNRCKIMNARLKRFNSIHEAKQFQSDKHNQSGGRAMQGWRRLINSSISVSICNFSVSSESRIDFTTANNPSSVRQYI
jgi:hypothetical protein